MAGPLNAVPDLAKTKSNTECAELLHLATLHGINPESSVIVGKLEDDLKEIHDKIHELLAPHLVNNGQTATD